ncbi:MAG TPA: recombination protein RecR [Spirochaetia bacterium]|nr:MAG: recombination protein RecR [Spirochaetes bacterium GWB1_36_13]HCL56955.1 recombination protein RecR [Spirochaetia bacterium]
MMVYPQALEKLIKNLKKIPGIGPKSAERIAFFFLSSNQEYIQELSENLSDLKDHLKKCPQCFSLTSQEGLCSVCSSEERDRSLICVVESYRDLIVIENTGDYKGLYHILEGRLSPLDGMMPDKIKIMELIERVKKEKPKEIIMATNPNVEGDSTAFYISKLLKDFPVKITRLAKGLPVGSDLEFADMMSLMNSFKNREIM